jgi:hypothetical protein
MIRYDNASSDLDLYDLKCFAPLSLLHEPKPNQLVMNKKQSSITSALALFNKDPDEERNIRVRKELASVSKLS